MRRWIALGCLGLALVAAPSASAKGPFQICGSSGCTILGDETQPPIRFGTDAPDPVADAAVPAPYYIIRFANDVLNPPLAYWVPSAARLKFWTGKWAATLPGEEAVLRDKAAGITPFVAPRGVTAYVDYEPVKASTGYLKLFTIGTPVTLTRQRGWYEVWLRGGHTPWNDGGSQVWISRTGNY